MIRFALVDDDDKSADRADFLLRAQKEPRLVSLHIEPASVCNLTCKFCDFHAQQSGTRFKKGYGIMPLDLFRLVVKQIGQLSHRVVRFTCIFMVNR